jgi:hypothetical protein
MDDKARLITVHFSNVMLVNVGRVRVLFYLLKNFRKMEQRCRTYGFAMIPANVRYDNNLSYFDRLLFGEISTNTTIKDSHYWYCCEPDEYFAEAMDVTPTKIARGIKALQKAQYIVIEKHGRNGRRIYPTVKAYDNSSLPNPYNR